MKGVLTIMARSLFDMADPRLMVLKEKRYQIIRQKNALTRRCSSFLLTQIFALVFTFAVNIFTIEMPKDYLISIIFVLLYNIWTVVVTFRLYSLVMHTTTTTKIEEVISEKSQRQSINDEEIQNLISSADRILGKIIAGSNIISSFVISSFLLLLIMVMILWGKNILSLVFPFQF